MSTENQTLSGAELIAQERHRQISVEGWTPEHDDQHDDESMLQAAAVYMSQASDFGSPLNDVPWPWGEEWFKPSKDDPIRDLVKAAAFIAAEIDRRLRVAKSPATRKTTTAMRHSVRNNKPTRARNRAGEEGR